MINGIDVSRYQDSTPSLAGVEFLIARATYGTAVDLRYLQHIQAAERAGIVTGAYHFGRAGVISPIASQVGTFLKVAGDVDLYALDLESDGSNQAMSPAEARDFIERVQSTGRACGLYHSTSGYPDVGQDWRWVADYRPIDEPPIAWDVWQWTSFAGGIHLDRNRFRGTSAQLRALGKGDVEMRFAKAITGKLLPVAKDDPWTYLDGSPGGSFSAATTVPALGLVDAHAGLYLVRITTGRAYDDGQQRPTLVQVRSNRTLVDMPPPPAPIDRDAILDEAIAAVTALKGAQP
ncbi:MAG TPA: glycoside hydrolase family 25 protein [Candidatus Limnocylindrales bacterium]|nr:glycoside hydrolase family 25 protein [Candidatus Limnocylindrales bacterium]